MKEHHRQSFRWGPHAIGISTAKPKDYELPSEPIEAATPYGLWLGLRESDSPLQVGDILECETGDLRIYKYVGFEEVQWQLPEVKTTAADEPTGPDAPPAAANESTPSPS